MIDVEMLKKADSITRRMHLIKNICERINVDIYYLFGLLNMFNVKNRGWWFFQRSAFTGILKEDFDKFNAYMDKFSKNFKSYDENMINSSISESQVLLEKLITNLETNLFVSRESDEATVKSYIDDNTRGIIAQGLKNS